MEFDDTKSPVQPSGIYPMLYAFWKKDGSLDEPAMAHQVEHVTAVGADGIAVLGLVTESHRLQATERLSLARTVGNLLAQRLPYSVTVTGETIDEQIKFADEVRRIGADWLILQPPLRHRMEETQLIDFFAHIAESCDCSLGVQNNPEHLLNAFSTDGLLRLHRAVPRITIAKVEGPVVTAEPLIAATAESMVSFGGHGGIEQTRLLRAGAHGLIPAPDCLQLQILIQRLWLTGTIESRQKAEAIETALLPLVVFMNRSIDVLLCYGRQFMARRLGLTDTTDRFGLIQPTSFGLEETDRLFQMITRVEDQFLR
ncbi:dihydrodipicolinate synthase family protein [Aurantimonas sp. A2-1-M11]|uniref:dihydrodipicolinate synthase family protein n=1 Tax=Aurantimonas sp. A2-1-M11 TaxID=3113712 RepID=UPI002F92FE66